MDKSEAGIYTFSQSEESRNKLLKGKSSFCDTNVWKCLLSTCWNIKMFVRTHLLIWLLLSFDLIVDVSTSKIAISWCQDLWLARVRDFSSLVWSSYRSPVGFLLFWFSEKDIFRKQAYKIECTNKCWDYEYIGYLPGRWWGLTKNRKNKL